MTFEFRNTYVSKKRALLGTWFLYLRLHIGRHSGITIRVFGYEIGLDIKFQLEEKNKK